MNDVKEKEISGIPPAFTEEEMKDDPLRNKDSGLKSAFPEEELESKLSLENFDIEENGEMIATPQPEEDKADEDKDSEGEKTEPSKEDKAKEEPKPAEMTDVKEPVINQAVLDRAASMGITAETAKRFGSEQELSSFLDRYQQPAQPAPAKETESKPEEPTSDEYIPLENEEDYDPEFVRMHREKWELQQTVKRLEEQSKTIEQTETQRRNERLLNEFDGLVKNSSDEYREYLGEGGLRDLSPGTQEYQNREKIMTEMVAIAEGYKQVGKPVPPMKLLYERSLNGLFPDAVKKAAQKEIESQLKKDKGKLTHRPGGRAVNTKAELDGTSRAIQKSREFDARLGLGD